MKKTTWFLFAVFGSLSAQGFLLERFDELRWSFLKKYLIGNEQTDAVAQKSKKYVSCLLLDTEGLVRGNFGYGDLPRNLKKKVLIDSRVKAFLESDTENVNIRRLNPHESYLNNAVDVYVQAQKADIDTSRDRLSDTFMFLASAGPLFLSPGMSLIAGSVIALGYSGKEVWAFLCAEKKRDHIFSLAKNGLITAALIEIGLAYDRSYSNGGVVAENYNAIYWSYKALAAEFLFSQTVGFFTSKNFKIQQRSRQLAASAQEIITEELKTDQVAGGKGRRKRCFPRTNHFTRFT